MVKPSDMTIMVTAPVVVLALILIGAAGFIVYKKKKGEREKWMISVQINERSDEKVNTVSTKHTQSEWVEERNKVTKNNLAFTTVTEIICLLFWFQPSALHLVSKTYFGYISADLTHTSCFR